MLNHLKSSDLLARGIQLAIIAIITKKKGKVSLALLRPAYTLTPRSPSPKENKHTPWRPLRAQRLQVRARVGVDPRMHATNGCRLQAQAYPYFLGQGFISSQHQPPWGTENWSRPRGLPVLLCRGNT